MTQTKRMFIIGLVIGALGCLIGVSVGKGLAQSSDHHRAKYHIYIGLPECDRGETNWSLDESQPDHIIAVCWYDAPGPEPKPEPMPEE